MSLNPTKPCSKCLKARQEAARLLGLGPKKRLIQLELGDVVVGADHVIQSIRKPDTDLDELTKLIGKRVYIAGKKLIDVSGEKPVPLADLGLIVKVSPLTGE